MPRASTATHKGCRVDGQVQPAGGEVHFRPANGGVYEGVIYVATTITVPVRPDGTFTVTLPPSRVMGPYTMTVGGLTYKVMVPDAEQVSFAELIGASGA